MSDRLRLTVFGGGLMVIFAAAFGLGALVGDPGSPSPALDTHSVAPATPGSTAPVSPGHDHEGHRP
ncbi:hypothetical protein [Nocardia aurantia]|uniref:Uncharacterized protein n=1 Tax=Nocardia aurantia TaxID=2585199 RepID=A0A7K0DW91_9NOCA|nr:hypothetical protein [Nocardia aurantia]MQY29858.1 hypothetical protein [Nocardia aurantia]